MRKNWKKLAIMAAVFAAGIVQVTDVYAIWPLRRRPYNRYDNGGYTQTYGTTGAYATTPAMPNATVTAPGVGVTTGPGGVGVAAPGVGVNANRAGAAVRAPGAGVNIEPSGQGAGITARGQTPDVVQPR